MQFDFSCADWSDEDTSPFEQQSQPQCCDWTESTDSCSLSSRSQCSSYYSVARRTPLIRFAQEDEIHEIPHVNDFDPQDIQAIWYSPAEFKEMRNRVQQQITTATSSRRCSYGSSSDDNDTMRGLENKTAAGYATRLMHKRQASQAVMLEQELHWTLGRPCDPQQIAAAYRSVSATCHALAVEQAMRDEQEAQRCCTTTTSSSAYEEEEVREEAPSSTPTTTTPTQLNNETTPVMILKALEMETSCYRTIPALEHLPGLRGSWSHTSPAAA